MTPPWCLASNTGVEGSLIPLEDALVVASELFECRPPGQPYLEWKRKVET